MIESATGGGVERGNAQCARYSVLIAAHNAAGTIGETLESLLAQTDGSWEACIVDDGSTDATAAVIEGFAREDARFRLVRQPNRGTAAARNAAASTATGDWLCILDADDTYLPGYLERMAGFIAENDGFDIYTCNALRRVADEVTGLYGPERYPQEVCSLTLLDTIEMNRIFVAAFVRRDAFRRVGGFRDGVYVEDYDLWLRLLASGSRHLHNPEALVVYRIAATRKTANLTARGRGLIETYRYLLASGLPAEAARAARRRLHDEEGALRRIAAHEAWEELRARLARSDFTGARRLYWASRGAPRSAVAYVAGLVAVMLSPRILAARLRAVSPKGRS